MKQINRGKKPFEHVFPMHYRYAPSKPYSELGKDFAKRIRNLIGDIPCILIVHSAGALIGRFAAEAGLSVAAMIGLSPAHGGSPGASIMYANEALLKDKKVDEEHYQILVKTRQEMGVDDAVSRSLAWDNSDQAMSKEDIQKYGFEVQPKLPDFRYDRYDHYGYLEHFVAPFASFDFFGNNGSKKKKQKSDRQLEWEVLGQYSSKWKHSDGVVVPYPKTAADGDTSVWSRIHKGIGHREIFFDKDVLNLVWDQTTQVARKLLGIETETPTPSEGEPPTLKETAVAALDRPTKKEEEVDLADLGDFDLDELEDSIEDVALPSDSKKPLKPKEPAPFSAPKSSITARKPRGISVAIETLEKTGVLRSWSRSKVEPNRPGLLSEYQPERMNRW